ncbi:MAG: protein kinase domain-containing protein, partial [Terriglobales bacterium]
MEIRQKQEDQSISEKLVCAACQAPAEQCACPSQPLADTAVEADIPVNEPNLPERIAEKYKVLALIGRGGMGAVYKIKHEALNKIYAAKVLNPGVMTDMRVIQRFDQEAKAVSQLAHANLLSVHDFGVSDGAPYLVM